MKKQTLSTTTSFLQASFFKSLVITLFHFLVVSVPLFFTFNTSELFEFNKMVLTYGITVMIGSAWLARMILEGKFIVKRSFLDIPILVFVISQLLSVIFSIHPYTSLLGYYSRFNGGFISVITYVVLYYAFVSNIEKKNLPAFFLSLFGSGILVSIYGILEHFGHSVSCLLVEGGSSFGVDCWIQDVKNRVFATFGQPNWLAAYFIMLIPVGLALTATAKKTALKALYSTATILFFVTLLFTQSRSGFLGIVLGLVTCAALIIWQQLHNKKTAHFILEEKKSLGVVLVGCILSAVVFGTPYSPSISTLLQAEPPIESTTNPTPTPVVNRLEVGGTDSGDIRKIVWEGAIKVWQRYPWFGSGLETFGYSYYQDRPVEHNLVSEWDFLYNKAHNEFLNYLATTGIVGLLSYVAMLGSFGYLVLKRLSSISPAEKDSELLIIAAASGVVAVSVSNFFGFSTVMVNILMYLYFGFVVIAGIQDTTPQKSVPPSGTTYLLLSTIALCTLFLLRIIFQYWSADVAYANGKSLLDAGYFDQGTKQLHAAIQKNSQEATFYDELSVQYAEYALAFAQEQKSAEATALLTAAIQVSDATQKLNPRQINFYKTRARVFITLAQLKPELLQNAKEALEKGLTLAPTDAKLIYNLALVEIGLNENEAGIRHLEQAVSLKPNYEIARWQLALAYENTGRLTDALEQVQYIVTHIAPNNTQASDKIASLSAEIEKTKK